jgi:hypothetical protein
LRHDIAFLIAHLHEGLIHPAEVLTLDQAGDHPGFVVRRKDSGACA